MSKHTPELERVAWMCGLLCTANRDGTIPLNSRVIAEISKDEEVGRIVDLWNETLFECADLRKQRDELKAALQNLVEWIEQFHPTAAQNIPNTRALLARLK